MHRIILLIVLCLTMAAPLAAAQDLSGFWELAVDSRRVPTANLVASITRAVRAERSRKDAYAVRWCNFLGLPAIMDSGRPLDIRQGSNAIIIVPEHSSGPRYLYLDRATHIGGDIFDPTSYGDSIAHWEGETLVVDTIGFHPDRGVTAIPGGGFRTATSRLVERYRLLENGSVLSVVFTWTDPKVFRTPHTYEYRYYRLPADYEPRMWLPCDPFNDGRTRFLDGPAPRVENARAAPSRPAALAPASSNQRITGDWVRKDTAGAGSFGGLADQIPPAQLTPEAAATRNAGPGRGGGPGRGNAPVAPATPNAAGVPYIVVERPCVNPGRGNGAILLSPDSGGIHMVEHGSEVILAGERGGVRRIYLDGRPHPPLAGRVATNAGHSTGRYEGNVLIVDTVGLVPGAVPGGGVRTIETRLLERMEVSPDGKTMTITYTWQDPKIYQRPHTYSYVFDRLPPGSYAFEDWCDAGDPIEKQSIVPPPQQP